MINSVKVVHLCVAIFAGLFVLISWIGKDHLAKTRTNASEETSMIIAYSFTVSMMSLVGFLNLLDYYGLTL